MGNDVANVRRALASALAAHRVQDDVIESAATKLAQLEHPIRRIDICQFGICLDVFLDENDWGQSLPGLLELEGFEWQKLEIFPYGILKPDMVHVRLGHSFDGIPRANR
jgi:hypothetical protein